MTEMGRIPQVGDEVSVPGVHLSVEAMDGRRVDRLRVWAVTDDEGGQDA